MEKQLGSLRAPQHAAGHAARRVGRARRRRYHQAEGRIVLRRSTPWAYFGKSLVGLYLRLNRRIWQLLPSRVRNFYPIRAYGASMHSLVCLHAARQQYFGTFFFRNRPALELMRRLIKEKVNGSTLRIAVLGCSIGAEVYSILWTLRSTRPDLKIFVFALDSSKELLSVAKKGIYAPNISEMVGSSIFERLSTREMGEIFDWEGDQARVKLWLRDGITWHHGDAADPELFRFLGPQDIVVASNFLCHMPPALAERCLRNIAHLVDHGGHLFVSGVDLAVRMEVARALGWHPVTDLIREIHDGDPSVRGDWPWEWWGLEPLNDKSPDWQLRYAVAYRVD